MAALFSKRSYATRMERTGSQQQLSMGPRVTCLGYYITRPGASLSALSAPELLLYAENLLCIAGTSIRVVSIIFFTLPDSNTLLYAQFCHAHLHPDVPPSIPPAPWSKSALTLSPCDKNNPGAALTRLPPAPLASSKKFFASPTIRWLPSTP